MLAFSISIYNRAMVRGPGERVSFMQQTRSTSRRLRRGSTSATVTVSIGSDSMAKIFGSRKKSQEVEVRKIRKIDW